MAEENKGGGRGQQKIGSVSMVCGCGFSTMSTQEMFQHKQKAHNNADKVKGPRTQKRFQKRK